MKRALVHIISAVGLIAISCYDDLGKYDYHPPEEPVVHDVNGGNFVAYIGDSLIIEPLIEHSLIGTGKLSFEWEIIVTTELRSDRFYGESLRMLFGYAPSFYPGRLTITDNTNGMKYFYNFSIEGRTDFTKGSMVLSNLNGRGVISFIKPGGILKPNLYETVNREQLPTGPLQIELIAPQQPGFDAYWILSSEIDNPGVIIHADNLTRNTFIKNKFFDPPAQLQAENIVGSILGVTTGVYNSKLYVGAANTAPFFSTFGSFGNAVDGDYELAPSFIFHYENQSTQYIIGYEKNRKQFKMFNLGLDYSRLTDYSITRLGKDAFDPLDVKMDLVTMMSLDAKNNYAFVKDKGGDIHECRFYNGVNEFYADHLRKFAGSHLVNDHTLWMAYPFMKVIFFTSGDNVYRYNPLNNDVRQLNADFRGQPVTMLYLDQVNQELIAGVNEKLYYLDISIGGEGRIKTVVSGIPGSPVDMVIRR